MPPNVRLRGAAAPAAGRMAPRRGRRAYATGLDGIRAIAVLCVVLYHAGVPGFRGGFVGVDLFFVVSGYLVTALLQRERDLTGRIDFAAFFRRRARRLLPALVFMLSVVCAATLMIGRDLGAGLRQQLSGAFTFSSNWVQLASGSSYVDHTEPAVLTHLWSLAVEEQFYLLWPAVCLLLLALVPTRRRRVVVVLLAAVLSGVAMAAIFSGGSDPTRVYVGTDSHGFGLLLGAALALARPSSDVDPVLGRRPAAATGMAAWSGPAALVTVLVAVALLGDSSTMTFRGGLFVVNLAAAVLIAATVRGAGATAALLGHRTCRWLGVRSYALYLWHWPALVIADRLLTPGIGRPGSAAVAIASALLATEISWRWVEQPIRKLGLAGCLSAIRQILLGRRVLARRRSAGWAAAAAFGLVLGLAACSVVAAPRDSELAVSLAAGEQALQAASELPPVSAAVPSTVPSPAASPVPSTAPSTGPSATAAPATTTGSSATPPAHIPGTATAGRRHPVAPTPAHTSTGPPTPPAKTVRQSARPAVPVTTGPGLSMIGDSVMLASATALLKRFPGADIDAVVSRQLWDLGSLITPKVAAGHLRRELVVGLGTNGTDSASHITAALSQLPPADVVVLVNSYVPESWQDQANADLAAAAAARPHTCVADWHAAIGSKRGLLGPDGVHPGAPGGDLYASVIADTLARCG